MCRVGGNEGRGSCGRGVRETWQCAAVVVGWKFAAVDVWPRTMPGWKLERGPCAAVPSWRDSCRTFATWRRVLWWWMWTCYVLRSWKFERAPGVFLW